jgi:hypothetical protein
MRLSAPADVCDMQLCKLQCNGRIYYWLVLNKRRGAAYQVANHRAPAPAYGILLMRRSGAVAMILNRTPRAWPRLLEVILLPVSTRCPGGSAAVSSAT